MIRSDGRSSRGYVFERLDHTRDRRRPKEYSRGVQTDVRLGERLTVVPFSVVKCLNFKERHGGLTPPPAAERLRVWQHISRSGTRFDDFAGTVQSIDGKKRICVLLEMIQRTVKLDVRLANVVLV